MRHLSRDAGFVMRYALHSEVHLQSQLCYCVECCRINCVTVWSAVGLTVLLRGVLNEYARGTYMFHMLMTICVPSFCGSLTCYSNIYMWYAEHTTLWVIMRNSSL